MLFNPVFADYMQAYGKGRDQGARARARSRCSRASTGTRSSSASSTRRRGSGPTAAGILSSGGEIGYCIDSPNPNRIGFDLLRIMQTRYKIDTYQETYFVIRDFGSSSRPTRRTSRRTTSSCAGASRMRPSAVLASDKVYHRGVAPQRAA
jgi:phenylalanine-4-hydroxylase